MRKPLIIILLMLMAFVSYAGDTDIEAIKSKLMAMYPDKQFIIRKTVTSGVFEVLSGAKLFYTDGSTIGSYEQFAKTVKPCCAGIKKEN